jgi:lysyl-tRNA synthetase class 2
VIFMDSEMMEARAAIIRRIRAFFDSRGYLEVETPLLAPDLIPETCLEVFKTELLSASQNAPPRARYLVPSPEIWMKKIIARTRRNIYQIAKSFRNDEPESPRHNAEFTMLEYYTMDAGYRESFDLTQALFDALLDEPLLTRFQERAALCALRPPFTVLTMDEAFCRFAGFSLERALSEGRLFERACALGLAPPPESSDEVLFNLIFIHKVEERLRGARPIALFDYPAAVPCLARGGQTAGTVERWELYINGLEIANCYSEETDPAIVRFYFEEEGARKRACARVPHAIDGAYWRTFLPQAAAEDGAARPFPRFSGVALGVDRLIMALSGRSDIEAVLSFKAG